MSKYLDPSIEAYVEWSRRWGAWERLRDGRRPLPGDKFITGFSERLAYHRARRVAAIKAHEGICVVIEALGVEDDSAGRKAELTNAAGALLRQIHAWNDGQLSRNNQRPRTV